MQRKLLSIIIIIMDVDVDMPQRIRLLDIRFQREIHLFQVEMKINMYS